MSASWQAPSLDRACCRFLRRDSRTGRAARKSPLASHSCSLTSTGSKMTSTHQHSAPRQERLAYPRISPYEGHGEGHRSAVRILPTEGGLLVLPFQLMPALEQDRRHLIRSGKPTVNPTIPGQPSDILVSSSTTEHGLLHRILTVYSYHPGGRYMMNRSPLSIACLPRPHLSYCPPVETAHGHRHYVNLPGLVLVLGVKVRMQE